MPWFEVVLQIQWVACVEASDAEDAQKVAFEEVPTKGCIEPHDVSIKPLSGDVEIGRSKRHADSILNREF